MHALHVALQARVDSKSLGPSTEGRSERNSAAGQDALPFGPLPCPASCTAALTPAPIFPIPLSPIFPWIPISWVTLGVGDVGGYNLPPPSPLG